MKYQFTCTRTCNDHTHLQNTAESAENSLRMHQLTEIRLENMTYQSVPKLSKSQNGSNKQRLTCVVRNIIRAK